MAGLHFDVALTSVLERAVHTTHIISDVSNPTQSTYPFTPSPSSPPSCLPSYPAVLSRHVFLRPSSFSSSHPSTNPKMCVLNQPFSGGRRDQSADPTALAAE